MSVFRLEPLLRYRKLQEEMLEKELARVRLQLDAERGRLAEFQERARAAVFSFRQLQDRSGLEGSRARIYTEYLGRLEDDIRQQQERIHKARQRVSQKRLQLQAAAQKRKMIDKLKEKHRQRDLQHLQHRERLFFDDVATNTFIRKGSPDE